MQLWATLEAEAWRDYDGCVNFKEWVEWADEFQGAALANGSEQDLTALLVDASTSPLVEFQAKVDIILIAV